VSSAECDDPPETVWGESVRHLFRPRAARAALAVPAMLLVLAACGGDELEPVAGEPAAASSDSDNSSPEPEPASEAVDTESEATDQDSTDDDGSIADGGSWDKRTLVPAMRAAIEDQETAHFFMTTSSGGMTLNAEGDLAFRGAQQDMSMTMDGAAFGTDSIEMRMVDQVLYLSMPPMTPPGKFVEVRPGAASPFAGMAGQMQGLDPRDTFKAFENGLRKVEFVGEESVHGEDLEHYLLTVDFREAANAQGMPRMAGMPRTVAYDMWLDGDALMRRVEFEMAQQISMVMELSEWGEPVSIKAPARRDIVETPGQ
jgi:hypothetical protein